MDTRGRTSPGKRHHRRSSSGSRSSNSLSENHDHKRVSAFRLVTKPPNIPLYEWIQHHLLSMNSPFSREFQADNVDANTLRAVVQADLKELLKHRDEFNDPVSIVKTQFRLLDLAWVCFGITPNESYYEVLLTILSEAELSVQVATYQEFTFHPNFSSEKFRLLTERIAKNSEAPITCSLALASCCLKVAEKHVSRRRILVAEADFCTNLSIELLQSLKSEHLAALVLQARVPALGGSALNIALSSNNMDFVAGPLVSRILFNIWTIPRYLSQQTFHAPGYIPAQYQLDVLLQQNPKQFLETNRVKFDLQMALLCVYAILASYSMLTRIDVRSSISIHEVVVWVLGIGFIYTNIDQAHRVNLAHYYRSGWSYIGIIIWISMLISIVIRIGASKAIFVNAVALEASRIILWSSHSLFIILIWIKLMRRFTIIPAVGVLTRTLPLVAGYLAHFSLFLFIFCLGFGVALSYSVGDRVINYRTVFGAWFTLYQGSLSQFNFDDFASVPTGKRIVAQTVFGIFLFLSTLILLKTMLVAILNGIYRHVRDRSELECGFALAQLIVETHAGNSILPAPVNLLVYILAFPTVLCLLLFRNMVSQKDGWTCAYCYSQNPLRQTTQILDALKAWMSNMEEYNISLLETFPVQQLEICSTCNSLKKPITEFELVSEKISLYIFVIVIWLPVNILLLIQRIIQKSASNLVILWPRIHSRNSNVDSKYLSGNDRKAMKCSNEKDIRSWVEKHVQSCLLETTPNSWETKK